MTHFSRGSFLVSSLAALTAPAAAAAPGLTRLRIGGTPDEDIISALYGASSGIFAKNGLDVSVQRLNSGSAVAAAVIGHSIDIGKSSIFGLIVAHLKGIPLVLEAVSAIYNAAAPNSAFVVAKSSPIEAPHDLVGKTIATPSLGDLFTLVCSAWIDQNGGNSKAVNFVELPISATPAALAAGRVDGAMLVDPFLQRAVDGGDCRIVGYPFDAIGKYFGVTYYFCTRGYAARNALAVANFRRGISESANYAIAHKSEMVPELVQYTRMSRDTIERMPLDIGTGIDPKLLQPTIDFAARYKFIESAFPASDMIDPAALQTTLTRAN